MSRSQQVKHEPVSDRNFVMPFGKYMGISVDVLIKDAPDYLFWLTQNTEFELSHTLQDELEDVFYGFTLRDSERAMEHVLREEARTIKKTIFD